MKLKKNKIIVISILIVIFVVVSMQILSTVLFATLKSNNQSENDEIYENLDLSQYAEHGDFVDEGVIWVKKEDYTGIQYGCINTKGEFVIPLTSKIVGVNRMTFQNGFSIAYMDSSERTEEENNGENFAVIYNAKGQIVNRFEYIGRSEYKYLNNGNIYMRDVVPYGTNYYGSIAYMFCAGSGNIVRVPMDDVHDRIGMYSDGLLYVHNDLIQDSRDGFGGIRYLDAEGNCVLYLDDSNEYYKHVVSASDFKNGTAIVKFVGLDNNKYRVEIDKTGKWLNEPQIAYD